MPILTTKFYIPPPRTNLVPRSRLIERLNEGLHRSLTLISAPAGFGKTTLVTEWVDNLRLAGASESQTMRRIAWLSLDEDDNDPVRFLTYFIAALNRAEGIEATFGEGALNMIQSSQPPPARAILSSLINHVAAITTKIILILDDYHKIEAQPIHAALTFLLEHLPPQIHLVIATREDPDLPLSRLRAGDQLTELRAVDLRFTTSEAADFLHQAMGLNLSTEDVAALENRTEGWIAGLQLAAISMQGYQDAASFIKSFTGSHRFVMDYLVEEVLQQQPENIQAFLLQTSILDRLCAPLCDAVLLDSSATGRETLEYLERANLLVLPIDDRREWYRYHHLFADVLQARLMKERPNQVAGLHLRACAWYQQNDFRADAIRHALAAGYFERAADLIELHRSVNLGRYFQSPTWLGWVKSLPDELVRTRPKLSVGFAWELLFLGELEAAETRLRDVEYLLELAGINDPSEATTTNMVDLNEEEFQSLQVSLAIARAFHAGALGDILGIEKHARRALTLLSDTDYYLRGVAGSLLGLAYLTSGDLETAYKVIADAMANLSMAGNLLFATSGTYALADIRIVQGRLLDAISIYEQALKLVSKQDEPLLQGTADLFLGLSELYRQRGDVEAASKHLLRSEQLGKQAALDDWLYRLHLAKAGVKSDHGDLDGALQLLDEAERLYHRSPIPDLHPIAALKARVWIRQGRLAKALDWAHSRQLSVDDDLSYLREFEHITLARVLIASNNNNLAERSIHEALRLLERLLKAAEEGGRMGSVIEILVLQALAQQAQGNLPFALVLLERALILAEPEGYVRIFVDEGAPMAQLVSEVATHGVRSNYAGKLLAVFEDEGQKSKDKSPLPSTQPLGEPLSQREIEVLQLIAQGFSNREISEQLFLALDTVKGHNRKIFDKLQVHRRTEAVARARELGLL